ncbi:PRL-1 phosphatase-like [Zeugodacus cucurbitae]|uniref:PRL-1 phosphatase-like n=1 Tax=Zeugodacus cucurbitae TaxID=28588 RepID=UPI0023D9687F|nr:PRL-1 phosphatase-like [Zeugodacus cucurbitae]
MPSEVIEFAGMRFLITDSPNEVTLRRYVRNLQNYDVTLLIGVCDVNYDLTPFLNSGIDVKILHFVDGTFPDERLKKQWFRMLHENITLHPGTCVAVHCQSGLGRAALLVAITLIELGMSFDIAVNVIRSKRRGAFNEAQYEYLRNYQPELFIGPRRSGNCAVQ